MTTFVNDPDDASDIAKIRRLNDRLRRTGEGGTIMATHGLAAMGPTFVQEVRDAVMAFADSEFTPDNDPYGEHDCASLTIAGQQIIWKIDYFDPSLTRHSDDATDPAMTRRVLTIMLAEEY